MTISLIIPCYNEEENLKKGVLDVILQYVDAHRAFVEIIIVDDGSTDQSREIIKKNYGAKLILVKNHHQGKAYAILTGVKKARGEYVLFSDFDLATPIDEADKLIKHAYQYPIVIGSRDAVRQGAPFLRKLMAIGFILVRDILIGLENIKDTQCGFKLFHTKTIRTLTSQLKVFRPKKEESSTPSVSAGFDLELLFLALKNGYKIKEVPVKWHYAETKRVNFLKDSLETIRDIFKIKYFELKNQYKI